jgi:UPF0271 protein
VLGMSRNKPVIFVIDTSAIFHRIQYAAEDIQLATTPLLEKEMQQKGLKETLDLLISAQKLRILEPTPASLKQVRAAANQLGDLDNLSNPDLQLLALALDLTTHNYHPVLITNDYSIQNVAQSLSLDFRGTNQPGIREVIQWETYCSACGHKTSNLSKNEPCPVCGTPLKRRAVKKKPI